MAISQPSLADLEAAEALHETTDGRTGVDYIKHGTKGTDSPSLKTRLTQATQQLTHGLGAVIAGAILNKQDGLKVIVAGVPRYEIGGTKYTLDDTDPFTVTDDKTMHLYVDTDETVEQSDGAWPGTPHLKLGVVVTSGGAIVSITPALLENHPVGGDLLWFNVAAEADVDMDGFDLADVGFVQLKDFVTLVEGSELITPVQALNNVTSGGDPINNIAVEAGEIGRVVYLRTTQVGGLDIQDLGTDGGNIDLGGTDFNLPQSSSGEHHIIALQQVNAVIWTIIWYNKGPTKITLLAELDASNENIANLRGLNFSSRARTIAAGSIETDDGTFGTTLVVVDTESSAATDDLDSATTGAEGKILIVVPAHTDRTVVVKHAIGADLFDLQNGIDFAMVTTEHTMVFRHDGTQWIEISRSPMSVSDLIPASVTDFESIAYDFKIHIAGALSAGVHTEEIKIDHAWTFVSATGQVPAGGVPSGAACIVDVQKNGSSLFNNDGDRVNIAAAAQSDTSAVVNQPFAAGDVLRLEVLSTSGSPNGADDLTVLIRGMITPKAAPGAPA